MNDIEPKDLKLHLENKSDIFLKLWKKGCGPCKLSVSAVERLEKKFGEQYEFVQICIDDYPEMMEISESEVLPAFFVFSEGKKKNQSIGFKGLAKLQELLN